MKKIISFILVAILCLGVLTSCNIFGNNQQQTEGPSLEEATSYLHKLYKDKKTTTMADFDVVKQVAINGVIFPVEWTSDNSNVVIRESTKNGYYTVDLPAKNDVEFSYTLTATIPDAAGNKAQKSYTFTVPVIDNSGITSEPVEGVAYKIFLHQVNMGKRYYALSTTQNNENKFINTTDDPKAGVEFFVEKVGAGYKVYTEVSGVKNYILVNVTKTESEEGTIKYSKFIGYTTSVEEASVLTYNANMGGTWTATVHDIVWGIGTYNSFTTISVSEGTYFTPDKVGTSQFVMQFMTADYANTLESDKVETSNDAKEILDKLYALADGEQATGSFTITGKITSLDSYGNPTIVVEGYENQPVYCYRLTDSRFVVDAVITVTAAQMKNYGGTYEFMSCTLDSITVPGGGDVVNPPEGDSDNAVLDLMGNANLVSGSGEQNVFAANGITFTNDKASSTSALTVQASYAQRAYAGSTIKIEYPGMTKIVITFDDYSPDGTKNYMSGMDGMVVEGATFSRENDVLTITFAAATDVFQSTALTSQVRIEKIEVYTGEVENGGDNGDDPVVTPTYTAPVAGQAYDLYMVVSSGTVYFAGSLDSEKGTYLATTADADASVKIFFEVVDGGYNIYFMNGDVKTYINAEAYLKSNGYAGCHFTLGETATTVWTYDTTYGVLEVYGEIEGKSDTFFAGTYGTYSTVSLSGAYYKAQIASGTQFPARISVSGGEVTPPAGGDNSDDNGGNEGGEPVVPETVTTIPGALAAAEGTAVILKGTVCEIYQAWSDQYSNISFYIKDDAGNKILVFRTGTNAKIGDQVTVTGNVTFYGSANQVAQGATTVIDAAHVCSEYEAADCLNAASCVVCGAISGEALGHSYVNGACERCGATQVSGTVTASKTIAELITALNWTSSTTKQTFTLDDNVSVKIDGGANTGKAYNGDHIRIYATDSPAGTITISVPDGYELVSIKISTETGTYAFLCVDGTDADICNEVVSVSGNSVLINSVKNGSDGKQVRVTAIEVVYAAV